MNTSLEIDQVEHAPARRQRPRPAGRRGTGRARRAAPSARCRRYRPSNALRTVAFAAADRGLRPRRPGTSAAADRGVGWRRAGPWRRSTAAVAPCARARSSSSTWCGDGIAALGAAVPTGRACGGRRRARPRAGRRPRSAAVFVRPGAGRPEAAGRIDARSPRASYCGLRLGGAGPRAGFGVHPRDDLTRRDEIALIGRASP